MLIPFMLSMILSVSVLAIELSDLPLPTVAERLVVGPDELSYEDCVENSLLTISQALTEYQPKKFGAEDDVVEYLTTPIDIETRSRWAEFLANRNIFVYAGDMHELKATLPNVLNYFHHFFPSTAGKNLSSICSHINPHFSCVASKNRIDLEETIVVDITFKGRPYIRWTIWQKFNAEGQRITGDSIISKADL